MVENKPKSKLKIVAATKKDVSLILAFIKELAEFEKLSNDVLTSEEFLNKSLFGKNPVANVLLAYYGNEPAGFAVYFYNFSTFVGKPGLYLEDVFVKQHFRGKGIGKAIMIRLAQIAVEKDCGRFEWAVLDWNKSAIDFYKKLGAQPMHEWTIFRLAGNTLKKLAED
jgi:GNAT superfamily N-acetyltransferase